MCKPYQLEGQKKAVFKQQISKLVDFYCKHNKYEKLCNFYTNMGKKHAADEASPAKSAMLANQTIPTGQNNATNATNTTGETVQVKNATNATNTTEELVQVLD